MFNLKKIKISFLAGTLGQGGAERQLYYILNALKKMGIQSDVLCLTKGEFWEQKIKSMGIRVVWVGSHSNRVARLWEIIKTLRKSSPEIIQSHHFYTNLYSVVAGRLLGLHDIGAIRSDGRDYGQELGTPCGYLSVRLPKFIFANSHLA